MNDEDDEFVDLFDGDICYIDGGNQSGFYLVEEQVFETRYVGKNVLQNSTFQIIWKSVSFSALLKVSLGL